MPVMNSVHLSPTDKVKVEKTVSGPGDFIVRFGFLTQAFLTEKQARMLCEELEAKLGKKSQTG